MKEPPPNGEKKKREFDKDNQDPLKPPTSTNRIIILEERDIPFEEERPPNFSPHFEVKVHRARKHPDKEESEE